MLIAMIIAAIVLLPYLSPVEGRGTRRRTRSSPRTRTTDTPEPVPIEVCTAEYIVEAAANQTLALAQALGDCFFNCSTMDSMSFNCGTCLVSALQVSLPTATTGVPDSCTA